jgi:hypothetical protein
MLRPSPTPCKHEFLGLINNILRGRQSRKNIT